MQTIYISVMICVTYILLQSIILLILFNTDAFVEYCRLIKPLRKLFKIDKFDEAYQNDFELNYVTYLRINHNNFFVRLITCPTCLNFWLSIVSAGITYDNFIQNFGMIMYSSLFLYYLLVKVIK